MSEYLKTLIIQLRAIWDKLNGTQKAILVSTTAVVMGGLIAVIAWWAIERPHLITRRLHWRRRWRL